MGISTKKLVDLLVKDHYHLFEVRLILGYRIFATHFLYTIDCLSFFDEGIDGETRTINFIDFIEEYNGRLWMIDQVFPLY